MLDTLLAAGDDAAIATYEAVLSSSDDRDEQLRAFWGLADAYRELGMNREALRAIENAEPLSLSPLDKTLTALRRGGIYFGLGRYDAAFAAFEAAGEGEALLDPASKIALRMALGNLAVEQAALSDATEHFVAAAMIAHGENMPTREAIALVNALRARMDNKNLGGMEDHLGEIHELVRSLPPGEESARLALASADLHRRAVNEFDSVHSLRRVAHDDLLRAMRQAQTAPTRAYAHGFLGALYEDEGRLDEALRLSREAVFLAQEAGADAQLYRWEWQVGRILKAQGKLADAQDTYARAVITLNEVKPNFVLGSRKTFQNLVAPVYTQYADVLLLRTAAMPAGDEKQSLLRRVRDQLEELKQAEIEDYFANQCVVRTQPERGPGATASGAAVIYPIFLDDRIEVLVEAGGEFGQYTTHIGSGQATQMIRQLRLSLERSRSGTEYLVPARSLYDWLIAPSEAMLQANNIDILVIVPGGALRTVPLSALHDGDRFLIERYAVATTPAVSLTYSPAADRLENVLVGGVTASVQGFSALPSVEEEMATVSSLYPGLAIQDQAFQLQTVRTQLASEQFSAAHFATHGEFSPNHAQSFILTYDDKFTLESLKAVLDQRGDKPLDLLVLSACKTAAGDDRAALGLAGVAVQSGSKSALASLWYISDEATADLMSRFYQNLQLPNSTKAESLRQAQLALLGSTQFQHPSYWAPYLLIGSWQ